MTNAEGVQRLKDNRNRLIYRYGQFRQFVDKYVACNMIRYDKSVHRYVPNKQWRLDPSNRSRRLGSEPRRMRKALPQLMDLQRNIAEQAMLLLEFEYSLNQERNKGAE
jgi:hypothetical protein